MKQTLKLTFLLSLFILFNVTTFSQNYSLVLKKDKTGLSSKEGKTIIPTKFDSITPFLINKTQLFKAWKNSSYTIYNMEGKGDEKNPIIDYYSINVFPNTDCILTLTGGEWYRLSLRKDGDIKPLELKNPNAGFKVWKNGKRGIYNYKTGTWLIQPLYSNIYVPVIIGCNRDSILLDKNIFDASAIYYAALNDVNSWDIRDNRLALTPLIVKKDNKFQLCDWSGKIMNETLYDSIFYSQSTQVFYCISSNKITAIDLKGKSINCESNYSELLPNSELVFVADSGNIRTENKSAYTERHYILQSNVKDTTKKISVYYGYDNTIELVSNNIGIYNKRTGYMIVAKDYEGFWFYETKSKNFYSLPDSIYIMDTTIIKPIKTETKGHSTKLFEPPVYQSYDQIYQVVDGVYVKEDNSKDKLKFGTGSSNNVINFDYPFWGLKNKTYTLFYSNGQKIKEWNPKKYEYKYIALKAECYLLLNQNNTFSLINIYGYNMLQEKEYDKIIETKTGVITWKNNKKEVINF